MTEQETSYKLSEESRQKIQGLKQLYPSARSALLPALHVVQEQFGFIPAPPMTEVAEILDVLQGDVEQVVTFYRMYNMRPVGKFVVKVCDSISCYLRGSDELLALGSQKLGVPVGGTTPDGQITLGKIECLAACANAPCIHVNDEFVYDVTPETFEAILDELKTAKENPYYVP
jgi:NADH-quinone oxidoreductase E subunit